MTAAGREPSSAISHAGRCGQSCYSQTPLRVESQVGAAANLGSKYQCCSHRLGRQHRGREVPRESKPQPAWPEYWAKPDQVTGQSAPDSQLRTAGRAARVGTARVAKHNVSFRTDPLECTMSPSRAACRPVLLAATVFVASCATTKMDAQWSNPEFAGKSLRGATVLVVCQARDFTTQAVCEDQAASQLEARGIKTVTVCSTEPECPARPGRRGGGREARQREGGLPQLDQHLHAGGQLDPDHRHRRRRRGWQRRLRWRLSRRQRGRRHHAASGRRHSERSVCSRIRRSSTWQPES